MGGQVESPIRPGESYGDFDVIEEVGRGAFAIVYRAHNKLLDCTRALKVLDSSLWTDHETARAEILKEARMAARIIDPHVVTLYQALALPNEQWAFELEYLGGGSLGDRLKREGPLDPAEARRILVAVLRGLEAAHRHGIVHHDIKPGNVMLGKDGAVKLTDFGLGRFIAEDGLSSAPRGHIRGTPHYMAPEMVMGRRAEKVSDLWSVGVLLFRMLAGRVPFPGQTIEALFKAIQNEPPAPLPASTPPQLAAIALRCMTKVQSDRPPSAAALLEELEHHGHVVGRAVLDPTISGGPSTFLSGRERELATLRARLDETGKGRGGSILVLGEAGIGKSALLQAFGREARSRSFRWVEVRLSALEGLRRPLALALQDTLRSSRHPSDPSTDPGAASASSSHGVELLRRLMEEDSSSPEEIPLKTSWEIEQALIALAETHPLVLLLEDVHLCDPHEIKMLASLGAALTTAPVCLAMTYRTSDPSGSDSTDRPPTDYYELASAPDVERIDLEPLGDRDIRALLEQAAGLPSLPLQLVERVIRDSDGVPLYALELFRHLEASGEIKRGKDTMHVTKRWGQAELPRPLRDMVQRRLAGIGDEERALLETAAVAGVEFEGTWLAEVMDAPVIGVLRMLQRLYRERALVVPLERGYRFGHALYQEAIYKETAPDLRRALHRAWAEVLEPRSSESTFDPEALGWHWEQAGMPEKAAGPLLLAATAAIRRGEQSRAWRLAERAGILDESATPEELRANVDLLTILDSTFASAEEARAAEALHQRMYRAAEALGDEDLRRKTVVAESWHRKQRTGGPPLDLDALEEAAAHLPMSLAQANAWWLIGSTVAESGDFDRARSALERSRRTYTDCGHEGKTAQPLHTLALILSQECEYEAAAEALKLCAAAQRRAGEESVQAALSSAMATVSASQAGRMEGAGAAMDPWIRQMERSDQVARASFAGCFQAELYAAEGRVADARTTLRRIEPTLREAVLSVSLWRSLRLKARLQIAAGELEAAEVTIHDAEAVPNDLGPIDQASLDEQRALLETARGEHEPARRRILAAFELIAPTTHLKDLSRLLVEMVHLAALGLDVSDALPAIRELQKSDGKRPPALDLPLRIAGVALRTDLGEVDASELERAAALARDPRLGWHQATMGAVASLLSAQAQLLSGERDAAAALLLEARQRAQHLEHVWLELRALQVGRDADLDVDPFRVRALVDSIKGHNPTDADRTAGVIAAWTSGMPRA